jgi:hypothetical protein
MLKNIPETAGARFWRHLTFQQTGFEAKPPQWNSRKKILTVHNMVMHTWHPVDI